MCSQLPQFSPFTPCSIDQLEKCPNYHFPQWAKEDTLFFESGPRLAKIMIQHLPKVGQTAAKKNSTDTVSIIEDSFLNRVPNLVQIVIHCRRNAWQSAPVLRDQYNTFRRRHLSQHTSIQPRQFKVLVRSQCPLSNQIFAFQQPKKCFPVRRTDSRVAPTLN